jgi:hypothetical protein
MVREYEQQMPPEIMNMITSFDWKRELREIVHQEALMLDVGTDLEESVYLLILGVIKVEDLYEDLVENHELTEEKAQKVLYEIEGRIFQQLNARLAKMDDDDERTQKKGEATGTTVVSGAKPADVSRDDILAEIEKDEVPPSAMSNVVMPGTGTLAPASMEPATKPATTSRLGLSDDASAKTDAEKPADRLGLRTDAPTGSPVLVTETVMQGTGTGAAQTVPAAPAVPTGKPAIATDPIASGLSKPTVAAAPSQPTTVPAASAPKSYANDPYREPIE